MMDIGGIVGGMELGADIGDSSVMVTNSRRGANGGGTRDGGMSGRR